MKSTLPPLLFLLTAIFTAGQLSADTSAELDTSVRALPEATSAQKLKKATLLWALEDAKAALDAGLSTQAAATLADVETLLPRDIGQARPAPENLFPRKPTYQLTTYVPGGSLEQSGHKGNPMAKAFLLEGTYKKGPEGDIVSDPVGGWVAIKIAYEAETLAMSLCHPESPSAGDPKIIAPMFRRFENAYAYMVQGNKKRLADFGPTPPLSQMYLLVKTVYPDLILPSRQASWEAAIRLNCDTILAANEAKFAKAEPGTAYVNCDVKYMSGLAYAGLLFNDPRYKKAAEDAVRMIETSIYPDGASAYIDWQNEVFTYHGILVTELARVTQVTGNALGLELVKRTANYFPLSFIVTESGAGVGEFTTSSSWKQNWNGATPGEAARIVEHFSGIKQVVPPTENYFVHDRNIEGPRGRFGGLAFCGTGRDFHNDPRGKNTYAGCMALSSEGLSAALGTAGIEVKPKPGASGRALYSLSQAEHNATTVSRDFAALSTTHQLSNYGAATPADWAGQQAWLFTTSRMIGLVAVESLKDQQACGVTGVLQFVSPKKGGEGIQSLGGDTFKIGLLTTKIHAHDFGEIKTDSAPAKFTRLTLSDKAASAAGGDTLIPYAKGARHFYLVESYPADKSPAEQVKTLPLPDGLRGLAVTEGKTSFLLIVNNTPQEQTLSSLPIPKTANLQIHRSGEQYRPAWIEPAGKETWLNGPQPLESSNGSVKLTIPAYTHIVITAEN